MKTRNLCCLFVCFLISNFFFWIAVYRTQASTMGPECEQLKEVVNAMDEVLFIKNNNELDEIPTAALTKLLLLRSSSASSIKTRPTTNSVKTAIEITVTSHRSTTTRPPSPTPRLVTENPDIRQYFKIVKDQEYSRFWLNEMSPTIAEFYYSYVPQILCDTKVRVGGLVDGGKWLCNPWRLQTNNCTIYSIGVGQNIHFDQDIAKQFRCQIFAFDPDDMAARFLSKANVPRLNYEQWHVVGADGLKTKYHKTLRQVVNHYGHSKIDVLKVDVEGAEFELFDTFFEQFNQGSSDNWEYFSPKICQILIEVHSWNLLKWMRLFRTLETAGFLMFSREINLLGFGSKFDKIAVEYSYIHKSCLGEYGLSIKHFRNFAPSNYFTTSARPMPM